MRCVSKVGENKRGQPDFRLVSVHLGTWQNTAATGSSVRGHRQGQEDLESSSPTWSSGCQQPRHCTHLASRPDRDTYTSVSRAVTVCTFPLPGHSLPVSSSTRQGPDGTWHTGGLRQCLLGIRGKDPLVYRTPRVMLVQV